MTDFTGDEITAKLDLSELAEAREAPKLPVPERLPRIVVGARTDLGRIRENNEDKFDFIEPEDPEVLANNGALYAVADGMGGHAAGQIASELALKTFIKSYYSVISPKVDAHLRAAIIEANRMVNDAARMIPDRAGMGTTLVAAVVRGDDLFIAHVGDSRAYLIRGGQITRLTQDHTWVAEQVMRGALTEEEAQLSPYRNVITRSLGIQPDVEPDISGYKIGDGDIVLLCSDGLTGHLSDADLLELSTQGSPSEAALRMVEAANERGGQDNITVLIIRIEGLGKSADPLIPPDEKPASGWISRIFKR